MVHSRNPKLLGYKARTAHWVRVLGTPVLRYLGLDLAFYDIKTQPAFMQLIHDVNMRCATASVHSDIVKQDTHTVHLGLSHLQCEFKIKWRVD